jgi:predicted transcriptional regulator
VGALSLRLPDELDERLGSEATREGRSRSEVAREAIAEYLARRERERFMAELVAEARSGYADAQVRAQALEIAEEFLPLDNEALARAEGRAPGEAWPEELGERWWK